jgi:menaquinol-cytochrome c reductase iron-sulfur subunit
MSPEEQKPEKTEIEKPETQVVSDSGRSRGGGLISKLGNRRDFLLWVGAGLNVVAGAMMGIPVLGYVFAHFRKESPREWISVGDVSQFPVGTTRLTSYKNPGGKPWDGATTHIPCWVRRKTEAEFQVFAINCTHLGCPVRWFEESGLFLCPCHGGAYYADGSHAAGPPPEDLFEYKHRVQKGELQVYAGQIPTLSQPA